VTKDNSLGLQNKVVFYGIFAVLSIAILWLISDYIGVIAFSMVMVIILRPVHVFLMRHLGDRTGLSTMLTLLFFFAVVIIPAWGIISVTVNQLQELAAELSVDGESVSVETISIERLSDRVNDYLVQIPGMENVTITAEQEAKAAELLKGTAQWLSKKVVGLGMSFPLLIANTFIFLGIVGGLLSNYRKFVNRLLLLSPMDDEVDRLYLRKIKAMVWSMFVGMFIIAIGQGLIMGLIYWIAGIPYLGPLTLISMIAAMLPLGASLIALPVGIVTGLLGNYVPAIIILAGYLLIVANVDNLVRPRLVSKDATMSFAAVMVAALGGYALFGFFGVIYGPVIMILFLTTIDVYQEYYLAADQTPLVDSTAQASIDTAESSSPPTEEAGL
jgi:predicted PurR-regulated permease PerM